jgi:Bacterial Ig-like domain
MVMRPLAASYWYPALMRSTSAGTTVKVDTFMLGKGMLSASQLTSATRIASETTVSYEPKTQTATLDPYGSTTSRLAKCQRYTAKLTSRVKDKAGNPAIEKIWQFTTLCWSRPYSRQFYSPGTVFRDEDLEAHRRMFCTLSG